MGDAQYPTVVAPGDGTAFHVPISGLGGWPHAAAPVNSTIAIALVSFFTVASPRTMLKNPVSLKGRVGNSANQILTYAHISAVWRTILSLLSKLNVVWYAAPASVIIHTTFGNPLVCPRT